MKARSEPLHLVVPGRLDQVTGGYLYDARIAAGLRALGRSVTVHELPGRFPRADAIACAAADRALREIGGEAAIIDGLALPAFVGRLDGRGRIIALVHHPVSQETGLDPATRAELRRIEAALLAAVAGVVVTSPATVEDAAALGAERARIHVVVPGTAAGPRRQRRPGGPARLLIVATFTPRKGHALLLAALRRLRHLPWRLDCVGSVARDPAMARTLRGRVRTAGLGARVRFRGERRAAALDRLYAQADLFVLPSYHEGYGMAFAEAIRRGVPVLGTTAGAIPGTVPRGAGVLVPPGDLRALTQALRRLLGQRGLRRRLARGAVLGARRLPDWPDQARAFAAAVDALLA